MIKQKITTNLWFDKEAREAAQLYISLFANSKIIRSVVIPDTPSGDAEMVSVELAGQEFTLMSAGPLFKFTPAVSFLIACETKDEVDTIWNILLPGGSVLMELDKYPFSEWYGWVQDKYGLSWQVMFLGDMKMVSKITPTLMFVGEVAGKSEEAIKFYTSIFNDSKIGDIMRYKSGEEPDVPGTIKHAAFTLAGQEFAAMDSARMHEFSFNEAISFIVSCKNQKEIDFYWDRLSAVPEAEQCGWLKDKYGLSWQIVPSRMDEMLSAGTKEQITRVTDAFLKMKKFDLEELEKAFEAK